MESIKELVDNFCDTHNLERSIECENGVVDNGAKSITSIMSKIKRAYDSGEKNYSLSDITDLTRCAIIVDDFAQMPSLIAEMSKQMDNLTGHISRQTTGYIGIHLTSKINGIPVEMQLSTKDCWLAKQASEHIYARHREFEKGMSNELTKICDIQDRELRATKLEEFRNKKLQYTKDYQELSDLFIEIHKQTDLYANLSKIEGELLACAIKNNNKSEEKFDYNDILNDKVIEDGRLYEENAIQNTTSIKPIINQNQEILVNRVKESIKQCELVRSEVPEFDRKIIELRESIEALYKDYFPEGSLVNYSSQYSNYLKKEINKATVKLGKNNYLEQNKNIKDKNELIKILGENKMLPSDAEMRIEEFNAKLINNREEMKSNER